MIRVSGERKLGLLLLLTMTKANPIWSPEVTDPLSVTLIKLRPVSVAGLINLNCTSSMLAFNWISLFGGIVRTLPDDVMRFGRTSSRSATTALIGMG